MQEVTDNIVQWADDKGILATATPRDQFLKVAEEFGEVGRALARNDSSGLVDAIGDTYVTLVILAKLYGTSMEECSQTAYDIIAKRTGKMVDGVFIKEE